MAGSIIIKPAVQQRFDSFIQRGRVLFVSAPCGFGKSTLADALLEAWERAAPERGSTRLLS